MDLSEEFRIGRNWVQFTEEERQSIKMVLLAWLGRFGCEADPAVTSALQKVSGVDKRLWSVQDRPMRLVQPEPPAAA